MTNTEQNRGVGHDGAEALTSARVGPTGRTFHANISSYHCNPGETAQRAIAGLDYDARKGAAHAHRADELEDEGGRQRKEMESILIAAATSVNRKHGKFAEEIHVELPFRTTPAQRRKIAEDIAAWCEAKGCPTHWAVHTLNEKKNWQPHIHLMTTTRPVRSSEGEWIGTPAGAKGRPGVPAIVNGPAAMMRFRREVVAPIINANVPLEDLGGVPWHGGTLADTDISRPAKSRLPMAIYKAIEERERSLAEGKKIRPERESLATLHDDGPTRSNALIDEGIASGRTDAPTYQAVANERRKWVENARKARAEKKAAKEAERLARIRIKAESIGMVDAEKLTTVRMEADAYLRSAIDANNRARSAEEQLRAVAEEAEAGMSEIGTILDRERDARLASEKALHAKLEAERHRAETAERSMFEVGNTLQAELDRSKKREAMERREAERAKAHASPKQVALIAAMATERGLKIQPDEFEGLTGLEADRHIAELRKMPIPARSIAVQPVPARPATPAPENRIPAPRQTVTEPLRLTPGTLSDARRRAVSGWSDAELIDRQAATALAFKNTLRGTAAHLELKTGHRALAEEVRRRGLTVAPLSQRQPQYERD